MFERVSADDLMSLASRRHPPPLQVGAVLMDVRGRLDISSLRTVLQPRIAAVPRLRQRLEKVPLGRWRRPVWVDDSGFNIDDHLRWRNNSHRGTMPAC